MTFWEGEGFTWVYFQFDLAIIFKLHCYL